MTVVLCPNFPSRSEAVLAKHKLRQLLRFQEKTTGKDTLLIFVLPSLFFQNDFMWFLLPVEAGGKADD